MDGFIALIIDIVAANGLAHADIHQQRAVLTLPGYFRPTNLWDLLVIHKKQLIAAIELKSSAEAVALACGHDFDLILMDLQMPVLDGLAATKQIRHYEQEKSCARAAVLAYTSLVLEDDLLRDCGVDGVLEKPCNGRWCTDTPVR